jgi:hypothetical protein
MSDAPHAERLFWSRLFVIKALMLIAAAIGLRPGMAALARYCLKESIPLRRSLDRFDVSRLPSFRELSETDRFVVARTAEDAIGTDHRTLRYVQERTAGGRQGQAVLFVTYYSDPEDKVPHTPDVCYRQGGATVRDSSAITIDTPELGPDTPRVPARLLRISNAPGNAVLIFLFIANGQFASDRMSVRWIISRPGDRHIYFSKVEVVAKVGRGEKEEAVIARCQKLLREALPILVAEHYPSREDVRGH